VEEDRSGNLRVITAASPEEEAPVPEEKKAKAIRPAREVKRKATQVRRDNASDIARTQKEGNDALKEIAEDVEKLDRTPPIRHEVITGPSHPKFYFAQRAAQIRREGTPGMAAGKKNVAGVCWRDSLGVTHVRWAVSAQGLHSEQVLQFEIDRLQDVTILEYFTERAPCASADAAVAGSSLRDPTKRGCDLVIQELARKYKSTFVVYYLIPAMSLGTDWSEERSEPDLVRYYDRNQLSIHRGRTGANDTRGLVDSGCSAQDRNPKTRW
jgi:hypothetical protein